MRREDEEEKDEMEEEVKVGDTLVIWKEEFIVTDIVKGTYMPHGMIQLKLDHLFSFTGGHVPAELFSVFLARTQIGLVPEPISSYFEPVTIDFYPDKNNCGCLSLTFSTIAFNLLLISHRNPLSFCL